MLSFDEQLFFRTNGQLGDKLEVLLQSTRQKTEIWGATLNSAEFLIEQEQAEKFCFQLLKNYWGKVDLLYQEPNFMMEAVNAKLEEFFSNPQNSPTLFQFLHTNGEVQFEQFIEFILSKPIAKQLTQTGLNQINSYKVNNHFFIQPIYSKHAAFWEYIYAKKIYSLLLQMPLAKMERPFELMEHLKRQLQKHVTMNRTATIIHKLVQKIDYENPRSYALKQLHLFNVCTHLTSGRKHLLKLQKCITVVHQKWATGLFALNDKENTLLAYILFQESTYKKDYSNIIVQGLYLIENERLNNHAIELVVEYTDVLSSMNPQPQALVKNYKANYLEHVFYVLLDALVKEGQFKQAFQLMKNYELATCTDVFELLQLEHIKDELHKIEAIVQQDIAVLVDGSAQRIRESLATWQMYYLDKKGSYFIIAEMTSLHFCNLLKILFYEEQDLLLEKLLSVYKKYLLVPTHINNLRQFFEQRVAIKS